MGGEVSHDETDSMLHTWYYACAAPIEAPFSTDSYFEIVQCLPSVLPAPHINFV